MLSLQQVDLRLRRRAKGVHAVVCEKRSKLPTMPLDQDDLQTGLLKLDDFLESSDTDEVTFGGQAATKTVLKGLKTVSADPMLPADAGEGSPLPRRSPRGKKPNKNAGDPRRGGSGSGPPPPPSDRQEPPPSQPPPPPPPPSDPGKGGNGGEDDDDEEDKEEEPPEKKSKVIYLLNTFLSMTFSKLIQRYVSEFQSCNV